MSTVDKADCPISIFHIDKMPSVKPKKKKIKKEINEVEEPQGNYTYKCLIWFEQDHIFYLDQTLVILYHMLYIFMCLLGTYILMKAV